jgi:hypothetical protein
MTNIYSRGLKPLEQYALNWRVGEKPEKRNINNLESSKVARRRARESKKFPDGIGVVYIFETSTRCKVGFSTNPKERQRGIEQACGESIRMVAAYQMDISLAKKMERLAHDYLRKTTCFLRGEWYRISSEACVAAVEKIITENTCTQIDALKVRW